MCAPGSAPLHLNLGAIYASQKRFEEAEGHYLHAMQRNPTGAAAWSNLGALYLGQRRNDEAEQALQRALALKPAHAKAWFNLSYLYQRHGRYEEGWRCFEARDWYGALKQHFDIPRWEGQRLQDKRVVVVCEAGHGDAIQMCRYVLLIMGMGTASITLVCHPALKALMTSLQGVHSIVGLGEPLARTGWDFWTPLMSLPFLLKTTAQSIPATLPYLHADRQRILHWQSRLPTGGKRVGLVWKGNPQFQNDADRSLPDVNALTPLWQIPGVDFISLQKGAGESEWTQLGPDYPLLVLGPAMDSFADAAAIVSSLDLVVCVDAAMAHLAGALGRACWVMRPYYLPDWRWGWRAPLRHGMRQTCGCFASKKANHGTMSCARSRRCWLKQTRRNIDGQSDQRCIEKERQHAMQRAGTAHLATGKAHIGGLTGCTNNAGEVQKITIVRVTAPGKLQSAMFTPHLGGVVAVGVVQRKHDLGKCP